MLTRVERLPHAAARRTACAPFGSATFRFGVV